MARIVKGRKCDGTRTRRDGESSWALLRRGLGLSGWAVAGVRRDDPVPIRGMVRAIPVRSRELASGSRFLTPSARSRAPDQGCPRAKPKRPGRRSVAMTFAGVGRRQDHPDVRRCARSEATGRPRPVLDCFAALGMTGRIEKGASMGNALLIVGRGGAAPADSAFALCAPTPPRLTRYSTCRTRPGSGSFPSARPRPTSVRRTPRSGPW